MISTILILVFVLLPLVTLFAQGITTNVSNPGQSLTFRSNTAPNYEVGKFQDSTEFWLIAPNIRFKKYNYLKSDAAPSVSDGLTWLNDSGQVRRTTFTAFKATLLTMGLLVADSVKAGDNTILKSGIATVVVNPSVVMMASRAEDSITAIKAMIAANTSNFANYYTKTQADGRYLQSYTETDPVWSGVAGTYRTKSQNDALYYPLAGNPSSFLTSYTETDPLFSSKFASQTTTGLAEGTNLYYTSARFNSAFTTALTAGAMNTAYGFTPANSASLSNYYLASNPAGYISSVPAQSFASLTGKPTTLSGYGITDATSNSRSAISVTGSGLSYNSSTGVITGSGGSGTVTSVGLSSTDFTVSGSPVTTSGNITANLNTTGVVAGTYDAVTVDSKGRITAGFNWTIPAPTSAKSFNTAYRESTTNKYRVSVSPQIAANLTLIAGQSGTITFQMSPNGSTGWVSLGVLSGSNTGSLSIGINTTGITGAPMTFDIPAGYYYQMLTTNISNVPTYTFNLGSYSVLQ